MLKLPAVALALLLTATLAAQTITAPPREADFSTTPDGQGLRFTPKFPPLQQIAGAPEAFYTCFWEFGDGSFSFDEKPRHTYSHGGNYAAILDLTCNYDDGKKPKKRKKSVLTGSGSGTAVVGVFGKERQGIALQTNTQPRAGEQLTCIVSYRNTSGLTTDGRIHLFFNEKKFPASHFRLDTARMYFGELIDNTYTVNEPVGEIRFEDWSALSYLSAGGASTHLPAEPQFADAQAMLSEARNQYRGEQAWRFTQLRPGETRNLFVDLSGTTNMLKDTSALIHLEGVFEPFDPVIPPEQFELEIEIVSSHDPNLIAVSDNRVNYRFLNNKQLDYKVRFQNNGEGPANTVQLSIEVPDGLDLARMRPVSWYPECPVCPKTPGTGSCLDTASTATGLVFTFRNIYLPGSRQKGLTDKDSTIGFVKYRIEPERDMPKRAFRSRAKIVFDKNPPIYTNFSKTRFKTGLSPGLKAGYVFSTDTPSDGYFFLGASLSPYKSWKIYPQAEILSGFKGRSAQPEAVFRDSVVAADADFKRVTYRDSTISGERGFVSLEVPFLLRKNFSRAFGAGLGASAHILLENGEDRTQVHVTQAVFVPGVPPKEEIVQDTAYTTAHSATRTRFTFFGDLTFGAVRAGPNVGIRAGAALGSGKLEPFIQVSVEFKL